MSAPSKKCRGRLPRRFTPRNDKKGFTLIELLVVISIIAILSVIGITVFSGVQKSARDAKRREDMHALDQALSQYKADHGQYPSGGYCSCSGCSGGSDWSNLVTALAPYMVNVPVDPLNKQGSTLPDYYCYYYTSGPYEVIQPPQYRSTDTYILATRLEDAPYSDASRCPGKYYNFCPGTSCAGYHDISSGLNNFFGACSCNYVTRNSY